MPSEEKVPVWIAHGNPLIAAGLEAAFAQQADLQVLERLAPETPVVAVTDWATGIRFMTGDLRRTCRVLIVTDDDSELSIRRALELGVSGYLPLGSSVETVARAVRSVHRGGTALHPLVTTKIALSLASPSLTGRELEVLRLMMRGMPNKAIASTLQRSVGTAKSHVKAILSKLDAGSRVEAVAVARRRGLVPEAQGRQAP